MSNKNENFENEGEFKFPPKTTWKQLNERIGRKKEIDDEDYESNIADHQLFEDLTEELYNLNADITEYIIALVQSDWSTTVEGYNQVMIERMNDDMIASVFKISAKIYSTYHSDLYSLQMENACIIMLEACEIKLQLSTLEMFDSKASDYCATIKKEIDKFRLVFKDWIAQFKKDGISHEWGLFE